MDAGPLKERSMGRDPGALEGQGTQKGPEAPPQQMRAALCLGMTKAAPKYVEACQVLSHPQAPVRLLIQGSCLGHQPHTPKLSMSYLALYVLCTPLGVTFLRTFPGLT